VETRMAAENSGIAATATPALSSTGRHQSIESVEVAQNALLSRKPFSLKLQLFIGYLIVMLFATGVTAALVMTTKEVEEKTHLLEIVNDYLLEIQQARRFEKNYFLYGTNLQNALENVLRAHNVLERESVPLRQILGAAAYQRVLPDISRYEDLLHRLIALKDRNLNDQRTQSERKQIEQELRAHGQQMLSYAEDLMKKERILLNETISRSKWIHIFTLVGLLVIIMINSFLLGHRILGSIHRFESYAARIASGDYTPVMPARPYRDEFTNLAIAINQMLLELESREAILVQSHKMRAVGTLTAGVAHELNNPLNNVSLTAHMLLEDYAGLDDEERRQMIEDIISETKRSKNIIGNLLDFARESSAQLEPLDLTELLQDTIKLAANQVKLSKIKLEFQAAGNLPRVHGDSQQLRQVFLNLILNAIDASPRGSKIQVMVLPADDPNYVAVKVIDFGTGVPGHILSSIFDPFFTTKGKGKGTGLGLSVSQGIVAKHGGQIRVSSEEGKGSTFSVTLPITTISAAIDQQPHTAPSTRPAAD
jgi:two-component system NtrC family sensor kinase